MEAFMKHGLKFEAIIPASFIRFLIKQTGSNVAAGIGGKHKTLDIKMSKQHKEVETSATVWGKEALNKIDTLYANNPNLNKPQNE